MTELNAVNLRNVPSFRQQRAPELHVSLCAGPRLFCVQQSSTDKSVQVWFRGILWGWAPRREPETELHDVSSSSREPPQTTQLCVVSRLNHLPVLPICRCHAEVQICQLKDSRGSNCRSFKSLNANSSLSQYLLFLMNMNEYIVQLRGHGCLLVSYYFRVFFRAKASSQILHAKQIQPPSFFRGPKSDDGPRAKRPKTKRPSSGRRPVFWDGLPVKPGLWTDDAAGPHGPAAASGVLPPSPSHGDPLCITQLWTEAMGWCQLHVRAWSLW